MADISKIKLPSGSEYDIKDTTARNMAAGGIQLKGATTTPLTDDATTNPITINGESYTAVNQDAVFYGKKEFVFDGTKWHEFGDMSGLGALATKDSASGSFTPAGAVSQPTFIGTEKNVSVTGTPEGTIVISKGNGTANYTPEGSVSTPNIEVVPATGTVNSITGVGTLPELTMSVANETLSIGFDAGTLPTKGADTNVVTGITSATATQPTFTGTGAELKGAFTGSSMTSTGAYTPEGTVGQPTFTGTEGTVTVS